MSGIGINEAGSPPSASVDLPAAAGPASAPEAIYERLPYGLVVVDERGGVVSANPAALEMAWRSGAEGPPTACHEMFSCRGAHGPCQYGCLVERAIRGAQALPEIRIDTRPGSTYSAVWVTAAPLGLGEGAVLHIRPGDARDRRRRSDPHWIGEQQLTIKVLGRIRVDSREGPLGGNWLQQRPGQILKFLACERDRVVQADEIAEALWPSAGRHGLSSVRHYIHALRERLEPGRTARTGSAFIVTIRGGYAIDRRRVRIDADTFVQAIGEGLRAADRGEAGVAIEMLELAMSLYRGDLLEDEPYAEWVMAERDRLRAMATDGLRALARIAIERGAHADAAGHLERLVQFEPFDTDVQRDFLRVLLVQGRRTEAVRRYATFRARLAREFATDPGFTLAELQPA